MASWSDVVATAPEFAEAAQRILDAHVHKTIATLRLDGSPRISGIEASVVDGELQFGAMWRSLKALDLRRDPRFALHSGSDDPPGWTADAKVAGSAVEVEPASPEAGDEAGGPPSSHHFRADISEVVITRLGDPPDHLVIELWREGEGLRRMERR
jgi:hypothetical protein